MKLSFDKYHGAGNDFIMIDNSLDLDLRKATVAALCDRHKGIGADGLILVRPIKPGRVAMRYFNADGGESSLCGNGGRCVCAWSQARNHCMDGGLKIQAADGEHFAEVVSKLDNVWEVRLQMKPTALPQCFNGEYFIHTGSPHHIVFTRDLTRLDISSLGAGIRYSERYAPEGTNVDFVEEQGDTLLVRTYERGVEAETLACGTGVVAAALVSAYKNNKYISPRTVRMPGGVLKVSFSQSESGFNDIWLEGPAEYVFSGEIVL